MSVPLCLSSGVASQPCPLPIQVPDHLDLQGPWHNSLEGELLQTLQFPFIGDVITFSCPVSLKIFWHIPSLGYLAREAPLCSQPSFTYVFFLGENGAHQYLGGSVQTGGKRKHCTAGRERQESSSDRRICSCVPIAQNMRGKDDVRQRLVCRLPGAQMSFFSTPKITACFMLIG